MAKINPKIYLVVGIVALLALVFSLYVFFNRQGITENNQQKSVLPQNEVLKPIENSVQVAVQKGIDGHRVMFTVANIPDQYTTIEYEFSYMTGSGRLQGGNSSPTAIKENGYSKEILLGTCSAGGACTYDSGVKSIKFVIIFTSNQERRTFEKEFSL